MSAPCPRCYPDSGHCSAPSACPLRARSGHPAVVRRHDFEPARPPVSMQFSVPTSWVFAERADWKFLMMKCREFIALSAARRLHGRSRRGRGSRRRRRTALHLGRDRAPSRRNGGRRHHHLLAAPPAARAVPHDLAGGIARRDAAPAFRTGITGGCWGEVVLRTDIGAHHVMQHRNDLQPFGAAGRAHRSVRFDLRHVALAQYRRSQAQYHPSRRTSQSMKRTVRLV